MDAVLEELVFVDAGAAHVLRCVGASRAVEIFLCGAADSGHVRGLIVRWVIPFLGRGHLIILICEVGIRSHPGLILRDQIPNKSITIGDGKNLSSSECVLSALKIGISVKLSDVSCLFFVTVKSINKQSKNRFTN